MTDNRKHILIALALGVALGVGGLSLFVRCDRPEPKPPVVPVVNVPVELKPAVEALRAFPKQRAQLAGFYAKYAAIVAEADYESTGTFASHHAHSLKAFVNETGYSGAPKVGEHIDAYLAACLGGLEDRPLDAELKATLVAALKTISEVLSNG